MKRILSFGVLVAAVAASPARAQYSSRIFHAQAGPVVPGDMFAQRCATAGDVDHDGVSDLLVGTPSAGGAGLYQSGEVRIISGATGGVLYSYTGTSLFQSVGYSIAPAFDVNNDGHDDFMFFTGGHDPVTGTVSNVTVYSGLTGLPLRFYSGSPAAWTNVGQSERALAAAGDVDGDGMIDAVLGALSGSGASGVVTGAAHVVSGATGGVLHSYFGDDDHELFGYSVAGAGDVNADGRDDVIVTAVFDDDFGLDAGSATLFDSATGTALTTLSGGVQSESFGVDVAGVLDVDGDGHADFAVGTGVLGSNVRVFSGANYSVLYKVTGSAGSYFGSSLASVGDQDGDGRGDLLVGAVNSSKMGQYSGAAFLYSGASGNLLRTFTGSGPLERFGATVGGGGDSNGDGKPDLIIGAPGNGTGALPGAAYVFESACQTLYAYGYGCKGTGGFVPKLEVTGCVPAGPGTLSISITNAFGGQPVIFIAGFQPGWCGLGHGCAVLLVPSAVPAAMAVLSGIGPGNGFVGGSFPVDGSQIPTDIFAQAFTLDPGPIGYAVTNAILIGKPGS